MKKLILLILSISFSVLADTILVSDFDDTIKHTNVKNPPETIKNVLTNRMSFTGMPELINLMNFYTAKTYILTGSPSIARFTITDLLKKNNIVYDELITSKTIGRESTYNYKIKALVKLLSNHPNDDFILIGDDQGHDPEIYSEISRNYPGRILAIYIHLIKNRTLPISVIPYITSFDIAVNEYHSQRMNKASVDLTLEKVKELTDFKKTIPDFAYCPKTLSVWMSYPATDFDYFFDDYQKMITTECQKDRQEY